VFQQDGASAHKSKKATSTLEGLGVNTMAWLANSPDLGWIESLWGYMTLCLERSKDLNPQNFAAIVSEEWGRIPESVYRAQFKSIKTRLRECIAVNGGNTRF
jgi:hypothetical protein